MADNQLIYIPGGRFVSGDLLNKRKQNARGQAIPEEKQQFEVGIAVRKDSHELPTFFGQMSAAAKAVTPANCHQWIDNWFQTLDGFSMKISNGDKPSARNGQVNPNTAGCWVVYLSSSFPFNCFNNQNVQIDPNMIPRGHYVDCTATVAYNNQVPGDGAGIFLNPGMFRHIGVGEEIKGGLNVEEHAAAMPAAPALPPGAAAPGSAPAAPAMPGVHAGPAGAAPAPAAPGVAPAPAAAVAPAMAAPVAAPAAAAPTMAPAAAPVAPAAPVAGVAPAVAPVAAPAAAPVAAAAPLPPGVAPAAGMAPTPAVAPAGAMQPAPVAAPAGTASPSNPAYPGIMNPPVG